MSEKSNDLRERLALRGVKCTPTDYSPDPEGYQDKFTEWEGGDGVRWIYHEILCEGRTVYARLFHRGSLGPERVVEATLGPVMGTGATDRAESFADVVNVLRKAAMGDFPGAPGTVDENLLTLMDRGRGDSLAGAFDELADRLQAAHERESVRIRGLQEIAREMYPYVGDPCPDECGYRSECEGEGNRGTDGTPLMCVAYNRLFARLQELGIDPDAHDLQAALDDDDGDRYSTKEVLDSLKRDADREACHYMPCELGVEVSG